MEGLVNMIEKVPFSSPRARGFPNLRGKCDFPAQLTYFILQDCANVVWSTQTIIVVMKAHKSVSTKLLAFVRELLERCARVDSIAPAFSDSL